MAAAARLEHLAIRDFRNLASVELAPPAEGLVVVGDNGQGKSNLLEAVYYLQILRSARGAADVDLIRFGAEGFHLSATVDTEHCHEIGVGFERDGKRKRVRIDGAIAERLSDAIGMLPSVLFSPIDVELITGAPAARRRYLDIMLALTVPGYVASLQRYRSALARRNAALRAVARFPGTSAATVAVWEPALAQHGATLVRERHRWVAASEERFSQLCEDLGERGHAQLRYAAATERTDDAETSIALALQTERVADIRRGRTHAGPHRDDLLFTLSGDDGVARELRGFGSAGQQRSAAIALRMLEAATFSDRTGKIPVFLLDDPLAELDPSRSTRVLALLSRAGQGQTILAAPRESDIPLDFTAFERVRVASGAIMRFGAI